MNSIEQILHLKNVFTEDECRTLISEYERRSAESNRESCIHANTGINTASTFTMVEIDSSSNMYDLVFQKTEYMINEWIRYLDGFKSYHIPALKDLLKCSHKYRLMKYGEGGWIHPHIDGHFFVYASCTFQLNENFAGGDFSFWNGKHKVKMKTGDGLIFPASPFWVHEVKNIHRGVRYSVNSFIMSSGQSMLDKTQQLVDESLKNVRTYNVL